MILEEERLNEVMTMFLSMVFRFLVFVVVGVKEKCKNTGAKGRAKRSLGFSHSWLDGRANGVWEGLWHWLDLVGTIGKIMSY